MANTSVILSNSALRSTLYAKCNVKNVQYVMQIELTVSELAKCTNMKIVFAIYFNFNSPCMHAIFSNFYKMPCHEVPSVPRTGYTRELLHPSVKPVPHTGCEAAAVGTRTDPAASAGVGSDGCSYMDPSPSPERLLLPHCLSQTILFIMTRWTAP